MLPIALKQGTEIAILAWPRSWTKRGRTLVERIIGILSSPPSDKYDIAQHTSMRISSTSFSINTLAKEGIAL